MEKSTKKKWLWGIGIIVVLAAIGSMQEKKGSSESATPQQTERIAEQPQETKADRQQREKKEKMVEPKKEEVVESKKEEVIESKKEDSFLGTYEITDKVGCTIRLTLNEDETATITGVRGEDITFYCKWYDYRKSGAGILIMSSEGKPNLVFDGGTYEGYYHDMALKDGWFYSEKGKAEANHPKWRLKATKIK